MESDRKSELLANMAKSTESLAATNAKLVRRLEIDNLLAKHGVLATSSTVFSKITGIGDDVSFTITDETRELVLLSVPIEEVSVCLWPSAWAYSYPVVPSLRTRIKLQKTA